MIKNKELLVIYTLILFVLAVLLLKFQTDLVEVLPLEIVFETNEDTITINLWSNENGDYFFFLPGCVKFEECILKYKISSNVALNGEIIRDGMDCSGFYLNVPYEITFTYWGKVHSSHINFVQSSNVATMFIGTKSGNMDYIHAKKGNEEAGSIRVYTENGELSFDGYLESIKGRGNYTWLNYEKKPYSLKLSEEAELLEMKASQRWVLLANAGDPTNMRNKLVYDFAENVGLMYSPHSTWVDLYLNGNYAGLYLLSERNEVTENRIAIQGDGSFLISQEVGSKLDAQNIPYTLTNTNQALRVHYPQPVSNAVIDSIQKTMQSVENAIISETGVDVLTGKHWSELIDIDSWAKKYLIEEVFGNGDAGSISQFFYYDASDSTGKVYAGPVWDYDRTMGNPVAWQLLSYNVFYANRLCVNPTHDTPWLFSLCQKEEFLNAVTEQYQTVFLPQLEDLFAERIYSYAELIEEAAENNRIRWGNGEECFTKSVNDVVHYMHDRIVFLNKVWVEKKMYHRVLADQSFGSNYANYILFEGERLESLPTFEDNDTSTFCGWYYKDTNEPFDASKAITEDTEIYAKWQEKPSKKVDQNIKLVPLGVIAMLGLGLLASDIWKSQRV